MIWTRKERTDYANQMKLTKDEIIDLKYRRSGRSTELAFHYFFQAYKTKPNWVYIKDHHGTRKADEHLFYSMRSMAKEMNFEFEWHQKENFKFRLPGGDV